MALSADDVKKVGLWWARTIFGKRGELKPTNLDKSEIKTAVEDGDAWFDAAPAGGATNQAAFVASLPAAFAAATDATEKAAMMAGIAMGRGGLLP
jgi:hypothetical protein